MLTHVVILLFVLVIVPTRQLQSDLNSHDNRDHNPDERNVDTVPTKHKHHFKLAYEHSGGGFISIVALFPLIL